MVRRVVALGCRLPPSARPTRDAPTADVPLTESALFVIDAQDSFRATPRWERRNNRAFEANVGALVAAYRAAALPVFFFLHTDGDEGFETASPHYKLMDFLSPGPGEPLIHKDTRNCFTSTNVQSMLLARNVRRLAITGIQMEQCCETTARVAADLGYAVDFVIDGPIVTSAGIAAGIDMTLALLERDGGPVLASAVAREMVVYLRRNGAQEQRSVFLDFQTHMNAGVHRVQQHLIAHPTASDTLADLARVAAMSERNLTRMFKRATGISVHEYRARLRVERARSFLRDPALTIDAVARQSGFGSARQLRRVWAAHMTQAPSTFRGTESIARE